MKIGKIAMIIIVALIAISCSKTAATSEDTVKIAPSKSTGEWVAKIEIEGKEIVLRESDLEAAFNSYFDGMGVPETQRESVRGNVKYKQQMLDSLVSEYLVLNKAENEKFFTDDKAKEYLANQLRKLKVQYYLQEKYLSKIGEPTSEEIEAAYKQLKPRLAEMGYTSLNEEVRTFIAQQISSQKLQRKAMLVVQDLKDAARIDKNEELVGESINYGGNSPMGTPMEGIPFGQ